jgi:dTDP-glucose 4,6-dehydratase
VSDVTLLLAAPSIGGFSVRLLVTGGAGFIGSNFVGHLLKPPTDVQVANLDKLTYAGNTQSLCDVSQHQFIHGEFADPSDVQSVLDTGIDAIVNLAAETHVDRSILDSAPFVDTDGLWTQGLQECLRRHKATCFIHISTDEVYGSVPKNECRNEDSMLAPSSPYAASNPRFYERNYSQRGETISFGKDS